MVIFSSYIYFFCCSVVSKNVDTMCWTGNLNSLNIVVFISRLDIGNYTGFRELGWYVA